MQAKLKDTTLIITNYRRPINVESIVNRFKGFIPIWIINNNYAIEIPEGYVDKVFNHKVNKYNWDRWDKACKVSTEYVILLDDDIMVFKKTFLDLHYWIKKSSSHLVGIYGLSGIEKAESYQTLDSYFCENAIVELLVGSCIIFKVSDLKKVTEKFSYNKKQILGDDIVYSLFFHKVFNTLHQTIEAEVELLPEYSVGLDFNKEKNNKEKWEILQTCIHNLNIGPVYN